MTPSSDDHTPRIRGVGAAAPALRVAGADIGAAWGRGGRDQVAACAPDEDTLTLAWGAATAALGAAGVDAAEVDAIFWGTSRPPFAEGPSLAFLAAALGLANSVEGALLAGSAHAGMEASSCPTRCGRAWVPASKRAVGRAPPRSCSRARAARLRWARA